MISRWEEGWGRGVKRIKKYRSVVTEESWDVKYSIGNIVNNILITIYGARWV